MSLSRIVIADFARRHSLVWACSALLFGALAAISGAFKTPDDGFKAAAHAGPSKGLALSGDREAPPQRVADECTESMKRRRVCSDWLAVAGGPADVGAATALGIVPVVDIAANALSMREPFDGDDAFRVEPCDWSATRLRVCLGRAPPIA